MSRYYRLMEQVADNIKALRAMGSDQKQYEDELDALDGALYREILKGYGDVDEVQMDVPNP